MTDSFDVLAFAAHPDDLEVAMGGTIAKLSDKGLKTLFVDFSSGEPTRYAQRGVRQAQAAEAARVLGVQRLTLNVQDRLIGDTLEARFTVARLIRIHRPRYVFTTKGAGVHPDHRAVTEIVSNGVFYSRLPKWDEVEGAERALEGTEPHEIDRLYFARCRMEPAWPSFDFAVDVSDWYERKRLAIAAYTSVFAGDHARLVERYEAEDQVLRQPRGRALRRAVPGAKSALDKRPDDLHTRAVWLSARLARPFAFRRVIPETLQVCQTLETLVKQGGAFT